jgi:lipoxygenase
VNATGTPIAEPAFLDRAKLRALAMVRRINRRSVEHWSRWTYAAAPAEVRTDSVVVAARDHYRDDGLPFALKVLVPIPPQGRLSWRYVLPYYGLAKAAFMALRRWPIHPCAWDPTAPYARLFPGSDEGWSDTQDDEEFATLRLQGPNPFLLRAEGDEFVADYAPAFAGIWAPVRCRFALRGGRFVATAIELNGVQVTPGMAGWERAKFEANALDARLAIFGQHLTTSHLLVAQAFAIAAARLPVDHPLAPVVDLFTTGVLEVNHFAYSLLVSPDSYFLQSGFIAAADLYRLMANCVATFSPAQLEPPRDVAARGLAAIPDHPYATDATDAWSAIRTYTGGVVDHLYADDASVRDDRRLRAWHDRLRFLLPNAGALALMGRNDLAVRLASMIFNNVIHEVSGDFSPYTGACTIAQKQLVSWDGIRRNPPPLPQLADVFLFEQGAYAGTFNVAGNNLLHTPFRARIPDAHCAALTETLREELRELERRVERRNLARVRPFHRMRPRQWEWSVSF